MFRIRFKIRYKKGHAKSLPHILYCRLRVNGAPTRSDFSTGVACLPADWDNKAQRIRGHSENTRQQNLKLDQIRADLNTIYNDLQKSCKPTTAEIIKGIYTKKNTTTQATLLVWYAQYIEIKRQQRNASTVKTWQSKYNKLKEYIIETHKRNDIDLEEVTPRWLQNYYNHLLTKGYGKDHAARSSSFVKAVLDYAVTEGVLAYNATRSVRFAKDKLKPIRYLSLSELTQIATCPYFDDRLQRVADCFCFQCYTGLAYSDMVAFNPIKHINTDANGVQWITIHRAKTGELSTIPLLRNAKEILEKYNGQLPVITNQKMNDYLKEVAKIAGIQSWATLSTHTGRRTAGMYLLNAGLRLETVSKILGHRSVKITERHYAQLLTSTISEELRRVGLI
ncbi:MAG: phage integrase SAM-like domain-containing protein [Runella sp.]